MLLEGYLAKLKTYPKDEIHIVVTATAKSILAPSWELLNLYKNKKVDWEEYEIIFRGQMLSNSKALLELIRIKNLAKTRNVRLICYEKQYPCHRFILMEMIKEIDERTNI